LAHLILSDTRPDAAVARHIPFAEKYAKSAIDKILAQPYDTTISQLRNGPSTFSVFAVPFIDSNFNSIELLVHHEDVRRATEGWQPRNLPLETRDFIWNRLISGLARLLLNGHRQGVTLHRRDTVDASEATPGIAAANTYTVRTGPDPVVLTGDPIELLLACFGRRAVSIDIAGTSSGVSRWDRR
jgi:uncharacterized protein (TIGR03085 family)